MPPKPSAKAPVSRPVISTSSLVYIPEDAVPGYQDRIETGVPWNLVEQASRLHKIKCMNNDIPRLFFSQALYNRLDKSLFHLFLDEKSTLTLQQLWELSLPISLWDNDRFGNIDSQICFKNHNSITDNVKRIIKKGVDYNDRNIIRDELRKAYTLRVSDSDMTDIDYGLAEFRQLLTLNLCGNYLSELNTACLPPTLQMIELQANRINDVSNFAKNLPPNLVYLGLSRNLLTTDSINGLSMLGNIAVLDLSDNDIYELDPVLEALSQLPKLTSLLLAGNPCAVCAAYSITTLSKLTSLLWLDNREVLPKDRPAEPYEAHPDDLHSTYFVFSIFRIMSAVPPPKLEKGLTNTFHVELELPLLDAPRRQFLMHRKYESLTELIPYSEGDSIPLSKQASLTQQRSKTDVDTLGEASTHDSDVYNNLTAKNSREILNYTTFESNHIQWNKLMTFQEPTVRIFCPDLRALRDTFRTEITARFIYSVIYPPAKGGGKSDKQTIKATGNQYCVLATIKCKLRNPDWTQYQQHFHWDSLLESDEAIHWGDGDLAIIQYLQGPPKPVKGKVESSEMMTKRQLPDNLTCHFGIGIETIRLA